MVAEADEKLMERFFEAGTLSDEELVRGLRAATAAGNAVPRWCARRRRCNIGIQPLLDAIVATAAVAGRAAVQRRRPRRQRRRRAAADDKAPASAFVWKTIADPFAGRITMFRVVSGTLKADSTVHNKTRDVAERLGHLQLLQGKTQTAVPEIKAGDLGAVAKLKDTLTNDTLGDKADRWRLPRIALSRAGARPTPSSRRAAATRTRSARRCIGWKRRTRPSATAAIRRPRNCCCPGRASCTSR